MIRKMKNFEKALKRAAFCALLIAMPVVMSGCGKKEVYRGGEDYPYEIQVKSNGQLLVKLDGSKSPDHVWKCELETQTVAQALDEEGNPGDPLVIEPPVSVKQKGKERKSKAKFLFKPKDTSESYNIVFVRENPGTQETGPVSGEGGGNLDDGSAVTDEDGFMDETSAPDDFGTGDTTVIEYNGDDESDYSEDEEYEDESQYDDEADYDELGEFLEGLDDGTDAAEDDSDGSFLPEDRPDLLEPVVAGSKPAGDEYNNVNDEDVSAELSVVISVVRDENGKLRIRMGDVYENEMTGVVNMAGDSAYPYSYQVSRSGDLSINLPNIKDWDINVVNMKVVEKDNEEQDEEADESGDTEEEGKDAKVFAEKPSIDYSNIDDPKLLEQLKALDEEESILKGEVNTDIISGHERSFEESGDSMPDWYYNRDLHVNLKTSCLNEDLSVITYVFEGIHKGYSHITAESRLIGMKISFILDCSSGYIKVTDATYEGGQNKVDGALFDIEADDEKQTDEEFIEEGMEDGTEDEREQILEDEKNYGTSEEDRLKYVEY